MCAHEMECWIAAGSLQHNSVEYFVKAFEAVRCYQNNEKLQANGDVSTGEK